MLLVLFFLVWWSGADKSIYFLQQYEINNFNQHQFEIKTEYMNPKRIIQMKTRRILARLVIEKIWYFMFFLIFSLVLEQFYYRWKLLFMEWSLHK